MQAPVGCHTRADAMKRLQNGFIAVVPKHPVLLLMLQKLRWNFYRKQDQHYLAAMGPALFYEAYAALFGDPLAAVLRGPQLHAALNILEVLPFAGRAHRPDVVLLLDVVGYIWSREESPRLGLRGPTEMLPSSLARLLHKFPGWEEAIAELRLTHLAPGQVPAQLPLTTGAFSGDACSAGKRVARVCSRQCVCTAIACQVAMMGLAGLQLSAPEFTPQLGPCPPPRMLLTPGGASLSTQGCPSVTPVSKSRRHRGGRGGNGSGEPGMLPPPPAFPPAPVHPAPMEFSFRDEPAAPSSGTGIVQLRLADQLPEPLPLPPGVVSAVSAAAAAAAAADYAAAASAMQWSMPWETDCEALLAASGMSPEMAALLTLQPDPETPLRPHRLNYYSEDATPPPIDYQFDARYGHHHTLGMVCEEPWQKGTRLTYEDAICASADPSSSVRWPSPPRMSVSVP
ncbi:unnamed protein product, partial [Polarella glacialis]